MKKLFILCLIAGFITVASFAQSKKSIDSIINLRTSAYNSYLASKGSGINENVESLTQLNTGLEGVIAIDNTIIDEFIVPLVKSTEENTIKIDKLSKDNQKITSELTEIKSYFLYILIGAGFFLILSIIFIILFATAKSKNKLLKTKILKMEKLQKEHQKEIEAIQFDIENQKDLTKKEIQKVKDQYENEIKEINSKAQEYLNQKILAERELQEKAAIEAQLKGEIDKIKEEYEAKLTQTEHKADDNWLMQKTEMELQISELKDLIAEEKREGKAGLDKIINEKHAVEMQLYDAKNKEAVLMEEISKLKTQYQSVNSESPQFNNELLIQYKNLQDDFQRIKTDYEEKLDRHHTECLNLEKKNEVLVNEINDKKKKEEQLLAEISRLKAEFEKHSVNEVVNVDINQAGELEKEISSKESAIFSLTAENDKLKEELNSLKTQQAVLEQNPAGQKNEQVSDNLIAADQFNALKKENEQLTLALQEQQQLLQKEKEARQIIENELRNFIEELKKFRLR